MALPILYGQSGLLSSACWNKSVHTCFFARSSTPIRMANQAAVHEYTNSLMARVFLSLFWYWVHWAKALEQNSSSALLQRL